MSDRRLHERKLRLVRVTAATVNAAAVAKHHGLKAFINTSQMTLSQMSITETFREPAAQAALAR